MQIRKKDGTMIICLLFLFVSIIFYYLSYSFPKELGATGSAYGSAFFPRFLLGFIMVISAILIGQATLINHSPAENESIVMGKQEFSRSIAIWVSCMAFYLLWHALGYLFSSPVFMLAVGLILGIRKIWHLLALAAIGPFMYLIFENLLKVGL